MVVLKNDLLIAFERIAELKTVHAAATSLRLTQAAVTKRLRQLEDQLGVSLFLRSRRGMSLTDEGKHLWQFCKTIAGAEGEFLSKISGDTRNEVSLTVVGPTSFVSTRLPDGCASVLKKHPFLRLNMRSDDHSDLIEMLRRGEVDLAIVSPTQVPNEMQSKMLKPDRYLLVGPAAWKGRPIKEILDQERLIDFYESDMTTLNYLKHFGLAGHLKRSRVFINENEALIHYFTLGLGFGTLTESVAKPHLELGQLIALNKAQAFEDPLALAWYSRAKEMTYFTDLVRAIK